ncbi:hypothetical protein PR048_008146 [Dryococelus australis]|uniref:RING-type domain-containing protein n=1 Tax=Dryococelus australis TaxID=614101 RepID=A0ABQ9HX32_9NEOP|nr:hypothetical protein PR048_008146 [Dryococelus australis]
MYVSSEKFSKKPLVKDLNSVLICPLCGGYLIDATVTDCMHLFCRSCIVAYLKRQVTCPSCGENINELKRDRTYQTLVYKLVPGLYDSEVLRRIEFAKRNSSTEIKSVISTVNAIDEVVYSPRDPIVISLSYFDDNPNVTQEHPCRYLECPAIFTVHHLKKFIRKKYGLCDCHPVVISSGKLIYTDSTTLLDIAYSCAWNQQVPLELCYRLLKCHSEQESHTDLTTTEEGKQSCNSHISRTVINESVVPSSVSIESENANSFHCNTVECVSSVFCNHETGIENIKESENNFEVCANYIPNVEEVGCSTSRGLLGFKDICKIMAYVELKRKNNQTFFLEPKEVQDSESSTVNTAQQDTSVKENCQSNSERNGEISVTLPNVNNVLTEKFNLRNSSFMETSYSTGNEAACGEYPISTQETVSRRTKYELVPNDRNIKNTIVINNEDEVGNTANCVDECRISHMYKMHSKPGMTYDIGDTYGNSNVNKLPLTCEEENDIQPFCNIRKFSLPPQFTDRGSVVATVVNATKSSTDSQDLDSVLHAIKSKQVEDAVLKSDDRGVELLSHITSCEKEGECNNNTLQNVTVGDVEELVTKCIKTKLPLVVPKPRSDSLVNTEVPLILTEVPEPIMTDHALLEANDDDLVVQQVMEELMARHSLEGLMVEHGVEDSTAQCIAAEVNFNARTNSDCESYLSYNPNALLANEVIDKELALECESDVFLLCDQSDECSRTMQGSDVSVVDYKVTDGSSSKAVREVLPVVKYEDSVSVFSKGTENSLHKKEDYDEKLDEEIVNAVSDVNNLVSTDLKLPDLEIVRKVDGKEISVDEKDESDMLFCGDNDKHKLESEVSIKLNKIISPFSNFVMEPDAEKLKSIVSQVFSKYEPNCDLFPLQEAKLSADNINMLSTKDKIVGLTKFDGFTRNLVGPLPKLKETLPDCLENTRTNECAGPNVGINVCHFLGFQEEDKPADEKVGHNNTLSRDSVISVCNFLGFEMEDKPADEKVGHNNTLARGSVISVRSFLGFEEEDKPADGKVGHNSTLARGSITEVHDKYMMPELRRWDEDDWISVEPHGDSSQEHVVAETFSQEFIRPVFAQENCCTPNVEVPKSQEHWTDRQNHILDHGKNEDDDGEVTAEKISRQPRIVLHRIKHHSNNSPIPQKVKVKLGKVNCHQEDVHVYSNDDDTKLDGHCLASKVSKFEGKSTFKNIHHQEQCPKGKKIESQITPFHQRKAKWLGSTQKLQCCSTPCKTDQEKKKVTRLAVNAEELCRCEEQTKTFTAMGRQVSENCCVKKRKVGSTESNNASGGQKGVKRPVHKCSRLGSGFSGVGKTSEEGNLNLSCNCEQKTYDKSCVVNKKHDVCPLRNGLGLRSGDKHGSGGGGPEREATLCTMEAKDVRVVVERCDGKLKQLAAFNSSPVKNKDTVDCNDDSSTNFNQDVESKLPSFCVMLTRLSSSASKSTKIAEFSENKVSKTLEVTSFYHGSNTADCEMPQLLAAKTASSVTSPSVSSSQHTSSKNTSNSKNMYSEVNSCTAVFADEELSQDFELNINIRCGK